MSKFIKTSGRGKDASFSSSSLFFGGFDSGEEQWGSHFFGIAAFQEAE
jgi:hypothetical protein